MFKLAFHYFSPDGIARHKFVEMRYLVPMARAQWRSRLGFIWAAAGSAVGLGNIWRFPYIVGEGGGAAFIIVYLCCLALVGLPVLVAEITLGRKTKSGPATAFKKLGGGKSWPLLGKMTVVTGLIVSSFYSVISGVTLGYLFQAILGNLTQFTTAGQAESYYLAMTSSPWACVTLHFTFMACSAAILYAGVQRGIESWNKILMPMLFVVLLALAIKGLTMPGASEGLQFLLKPNWTLITPPVILMALGQAFFALSLGQGTMVTYGSYVSDNENLPTTVFPIAGFGLLVSLLAGIAIFTIVFSVGLKPDAGPSLMYETLPLVFSRIQGGYVLGLAFFALLFMAALTSQISAMEPLIANMIDRFKWARHKAVMFTAGIAFLIGLPCALSFGPWRGFTLFGMNLFDFISSAAVNLLIPLGGLAAVLLIGWRWGIKKGIEHLHVGAKTFFIRYSLVSDYFKYTIKFIAPVVIIIILLNSLGLF